MSDVARLGLSIETAGVAETRAQLSALATSAADTARKFTSAGEAVVASGNKVASAPDGFLPFSNNAAKASVSATASMRKLGGAASIAIGELGALGPAAGKLGGMLTGLVATGFNPIGLAILATTAAVGFLVNKFDEAAEATKKLEETQIKAVEAGHKAAESLREISAEAKQALSADPELDAITRKYDKQFEQLAAIKAGEGALGQVRAAQAAETRKLADARFNASQAEITALESERAALGRTGNALVDLQTAQKVNAILTSESAQKDVIAAEKKIGLIKAIGDEQKARNNIATGKQGASDFEASFGVKLDPQSKQAGNKLADLFGSAFNTFKDDKSKAKPLADAFKSLVEQGLAMGLPDIGELISEKIGSANFERLRAGLGDDLKGALDLSAQAGQQWGATLTAEAAASTAAMGTLGAELDAGSAKWSAMETAAAQALSGIRQGIDSIPDVSYKQVIVQTYYAASPARPFGEFMPYMERTFGKLNDLVSGSTPDINFKTVKPGRVEGSRVEGRGANPATAPVEVHMHMENATLTEEFLAAKLVPAVAEGIALATGKDAGFRVLS